MLERNLSTIIARLVSQNLSIGGCQLKAVTSAARHFCNTSEKKATNTNDRQAQTKVPTISKQKRSPNIEPTKLEQKFNMEWPKVTLFGDSITRRSFDPENGCWGSMLAHKLGEYFDVDFRGFEGYNSRWNLELVPKLFPKSYLDKVEIFIPFIGHNDSWKPEAALHVPVDEYELNMRSIIRYLNENGLDSEKIILITPTWYYHEDFVEYCKEIGFPPVGKTKEQAQQYSDAILRIAKDTQISVLDFYDISVKHEPLKELFCDGVHFSQTGARLLFDHLMPVVRQKIEARFGKALVDLWHVVPIEQRPEVVGAAAHYKEAIKNASARH